MISTKFQTISKQPNTKQYDLEERSYQFEIVRGIFFTKSRQLLANWYDLSLRSYCFVFGCFDIVWNLVLIICDFHLPKVSMSTNILNDLVAVIVIFPVGIMRFKF